MDTSSNLSEKPGLSRIVGLAPGQNPEASEGFSRTMVMLVAASSLITAVMAITALVMFRQRLNLLSEELGQTRRELTKANENLGVMVTFLEKRISELQAVSSPRLSQGDSIPARAVPVIVDMDPTPNPSVDDPRHPGPEAKPGISRSSPVDSPADSIADKPVESHEISGFRILRRPAMTQPAYELSARPSAGSKPEFSAARSILSSALEFAASGAASSKPTPQPPLAPIKPQPPEPATPTPVPIPPAAIPRLPEFKSRRRSMSAVPPKAE